MLFCKTGSSSFNTIRKIHYCVVSRSQCSVFVIMFCSYIKKIFRTKNLFILSKKQFLSRPIKLPKAP